MILGGQTSVDNYLLHINLFHFYVKCRKQIKRIQTDGKQEYKYMFFLKIIREMQIKITMIISQTNENS